MCSSDIFLGLLAILFPPLPVWVKTGLCSADSLVNILLCVLGFIPGLIHAWYIIAKYPEESHEYQRVSDGGEGGNGRVTYVFVSDDGRRRQQHKPGRQQPKPQGNMSYGTTDNNNASGPSRSNGEGRSDVPPPSYAAVVAGDHKVQSRE